MDIFFFHCYKYLSILGSVLMGCILRFILWYELLKKSKMLKWCYLFLFPWFLSCKRPLNCVMKEIFAAHVYNPSPTQRLTVRDPLCFGLFCFNNLLRIAIWLSARCIFSGNEKSVSNKLFSGLQTYFNLRYSSWKKTKWKEHTFT